MPRATKARTGSIAFLGAGVLAGCGLIALGTFATVTASPSAGSSPAPAPESAPEPDPSPAPVVVTAREFPDELYFIDRRTGERYPSPITLEGKRAPVLKLKDWVGEPLDPSKLEGKVVVVDFWATWCGPCRAAIPKNIEMVNAHGKNGLVILGIHDSNRGHQRMAAMVKAKGVNYPVAVDDGGQSARAWKVRMWPTYAVIDHKGIVRAAGLHPPGVEQVVEVLLAERKRDLGLPG